MLDMSDVFTWIDKPHKGILGYFCGLFASPQHWRRRIGELTIASLILWILLGFDSTWQMLNPITFGLLSNPVYVIKTLINPSSPEFNALIKEMWGQYGIGNHWSAPVIYGTAYIYLSSKLESEGVVGSLNFFTTSAMSLMNIGIFEYVYNYLYSVLQKQPWAFSLVDGNKSNMTFFTVYLVLGCYFLLYLLYSDYRITLTTRKKTYLIVAVLLWAVWVFYPFPVEALNVNTDQGAWVSSPLFPQTYYVVKVKTLDVNAAGTPWYIRNDLIHLINVLCKVFSTTFIASLCAVKKKC